MAGERDYDARMSPSPSEQHDRMPTAAATTPNFLNFEVDAEDAARWSSMHDPPPSPPRKRARVESSPIEETRHRCSGCGRDVPASGDKCKQCSQHAARDAFLKAEKEYKKTLDVFIDTFSTGFTTEPEDVKQLKEENSKLKEEIVDLKERLEDEEDAYDDLKAEFAKYRERAWDKQERMEAKIQALTQVRDDAWRKEEVTDANILALEKLLNAEKAKSARLSKLL